MGDTLFTRIPSLVRRVVDTGATYESTISASSDNFLIRRVPGTPNQYATIFSRTGDHVTDLHSQLPSNAAVFFVGTQIIADLIHDHVVDQVALITAPATLSHKIISSTPELQFNAQCGASDYADNLILLSSRLYDQTPMIRIISLDGTLVREFSTGDTVGVAHMFTSPDRRVLYLQDYRFNLYRYQLVGEPNRVMWRSNMMTGNPTHGTHPFTSMVVIDDTGNAVDHHDGKLRFFNAAWQLLGSVPLAPPMPAGGVQFPDRLNFVSNLCLTPSNKLIVTYQYAQCFEIYE